MTLRESPRRLQRRTTSGNCHRIKREQQDGIQAPPTLIATPVFREPSAAAGNPVGHAENRDIGVQSDDRLGRFKSGLEVF